MLIATLLLLSLVLYETTGKFLRIEEDIKIDEDLYNELYKGYKGRKLGAVDNTQIDLWRNNYTNGQFIIPITFFENDVEEGTNLMTITTANNIFSTLETMAEKLGNIIKFVRYDGIEPKPNYYIRIGNFGGGCWSYVGRIPLQYQPQVLNIGTNCVFIDIIEHEMMHALGFFHEHARPDRDDHVTIHWDNIDPSKYVNFEKAFEINSRGSPYDYESIMHYTSTAFALDPQFPTISIKNPIPGVHLGSALEMTRLDEEQLRMFYRCSSSVRDVANNCIDSCPCRHNEGNCTLDSQCEGELSCVDNICVDYNITRSPTSSPITPSPTRSPIPSPPTMSPTPESTIAITNTPAPAPSTSFDSDTILMIGIGSVVGIFALILIVNVI